MQNGIMIIRILQKPLKFNKSFFLLGPRGTGKTSWVKANLPNAIYIDLLRSEHFFTLSATPNRIVEFIPEGFDDWIVIDEVQKIPINPASLLNTLLTFKIWTCQQ